MLPRPESPSPQATPHVSRLLYGGFVRYARRLTSANFHAVRLLKNTRPNIPPDRPAIVYLNHPSWWDPMIGVVLATTLFPGKKHFAVIDEAMLEKYRVFKKLGFVGITPDRRGGTKFLRVGASILAQNDAVLWVTAQGQFTDARSRPIVLRPGVAHLARRNPHAVVLPLAIEIVYWNERLPEALTAFGPPCDLQSPEFKNIADPLATNAGFESRLTQTLDALAGAAITRDASRFEVLLQKRLGLGSAYDAARWLRAKFTGTTFDASHGGKTVARGEAAR